MVWRPVVAERQHRIAVLSLTQKLLADSAWVALVFGLLASVRHLPASISAHPSAPDVTSAETYLLAFDSLALWAILLLAPFVIARAAAEVWPRLSRTIRLPVFYLVGFGVAYVLLANGGVFSVAFDFSGSRVLLGLGLALGVSYVASILHIEANGPLSPRVAPLTRGSLLLAEAGWVVALLGAVAALPSAVEAALAEQYAGDLESLTHYLELLRSLAFWSMAVLTPFAMARAASAFWPTLSRIFGFPMRRLTLLAVVYVLFSDEGVVSTTFDVPVSQFMVVLTLAVALTYIASVFLNTSRLGLPGRFAPAVANVAPVVGAAVASAVPAMVVWVTLNHMPVGGAKFLDYSLTRNFGETYLPYFANLFDVRYTAAGLCLAMGLALTMPKALGTPFLRYQPLLAAVGHSVAACLAWIVGASLSELSRGYTLAGTIVAAGMFSLALTQLAGYTTTSSNLILAEGGRWLSESKVRGFTLGASVALYGLLMHPALHAVMWFAALYEYLAVLALMMFMLLLIRKRVWLEADAPHVPPPVWPGWSHHEQRLETKADPRSALMRDLRYRFLEYGVWRPLWSYLMGLLYRSQAPLESVEAVCRTLRRAALAPAHWSLPGEQGRVRSRRMTALEESLTNAEKGLATRTRATAPVDEGALRQAAAAYVQRGTDPEKLTATLISAHYQKGDNLDAAVDHWFPLLSVPEPSSRWYDPPWVRSRVRARERDQRARLVEESVAHFFGAASRRVAEPSATVAGAAA